MKYDDWHKDSNNNWFDVDRVNKELFDLKFAVHALVHTLTDKGSMKHEVACNASIGIGDRIDYLHDSIMRLIGGRNEHERG